jgi:hypothetical protein
MLRISADNGLKDFADHVIALPVNPNSSLGSPKLRGGSLFDFVILILCLCGEQFNNNAEVIFTARLRRLTAD